MASRSCATVTFRCSGVQCKAERNAGQHRLGKPRGRGSDWSGRRGAERRPWAALVEAEALVVLIEFLLFEGTLFDSATSGR